MLPGIIIALFIRVVIGSLIAAILLRAAAKWVLGREVPYGQAYVTVLLPALINVVLGSILGYAIGSVTQSREAVSVVALLMLPVGFLILSIFISFQLGIPVGRACLVSIVMMAIGVGIILTVVIIVSLVSSLVL